MIYVKYVLNGNDHRETFVSLSALEALLTVLFKQDAIILEIKE